MTDIHASAEDERASGSGRRRFCQILLGGMTTVAAGTVGYPVVTFLRLPKSSQPEEAMEVAVRDLADGSAVWGEHLGRQIVVIRRGEEIRAFDGACTHLGCIVQWDRAEGVFHCPCHGAAFDDNGNPVYGPVNTPLRHVEFNVKDGVLRIA
jgi:Rieske Fe-S protein